MYIFCDHFSIFKIFNPESQFAEIKAESIINSQNKFEVFAWFQNQGKFRQISYTFETLAKPAQSIDHLLSRLVHFPVLMQFWLNFSPFFDSLLKTERNLQSISKF